VVINNAAVINNGGAVRRTRRYSGDRSLNVLLLIGVIDATGTGLYLASTAVFFIQVVGLTATQLGLGLSLAGLLGLLLQPLIGRMADRWGPRPAFVGLYVSRAAGFASYTFVHDVATFLIAAAVVGIGEQSVQGVFQALVEEVVGPERRVDTMARIRVVHNVGFTLGALVAIPAIATGSSTALVALMMGNAVSFLLAIALIPLVRFGHPQPRTVRSGRLGLLRIQAIRDGALVRLMALNGVLLLHISLLSVAMPLWLTLHTSAPRYLIAVLLGVNTVLAVLFQLRVSRSALTAADSVRTLQRAAVALAVCAVLFALAGHLPTPGAVVILVAAVVALTVAELLQSAGGWGLSYALAPLENRVEYLATFGLGMSAQSVLGPSLVTVGVIGNGDWGWLGLAIVFLVGGCLCRPLAEAAGVPRQEFERDPVGSSS
jgi:MFS family permease